MKVTRSDKPDYSLVRKWLRNELYNHKDYKLWVLKLYYKQPLKLLNSNK